MKQNEISSMLLITAMLACATQVDAQALGVTWTQLKRPDMWSPSDLLNLESFQEELLLIGYREVWSSHDGASWAYASSVLPSPTYQSNSTFRFNESLGMTTSTACWISDNGRFWSEASKLPFYSSRIAEFGSRLLAVGGLNEDDYSRGYVYSSEDAIDWQLETDSAPWAARAFPEIVSFKERLWILGGRHYHQLPRDPYDVWYSEDGVDWVQAPTPPWMGLARDNFSVVVFQDRLWVMGGLLTTAENGQVAPREVWASDDGLEWELMTDDAPWYGRSNAGVTVHDGRLWMCGGLSDYGLMNDVWYTEDGVNWVNPLPPMWEKRYAHGAAVFQDEMWIMGGDNGDKRFSDVWHSEDGLAWTQAPDAGWAPRRGMGVAVLNDVLYVAGGQDGKTEGALYYNDVWCSENGETWQDLTATAPWSPRGFAKLLVFQDKLWLLSGEYRGNILRDIWSSKDGITWSLEMDQAPWPRIHSVAAAVHKGRMYTSDGWASSDGITWEELPGRDWSYQLPIMLSNGGWMWYFSGLYYIDIPDWVYSTAILGSPDGSSWKILAQNPPWPGREAAAGLVFKDSLWILGGSGEFDRPLNDIWRSSGMPPTHTADLDGDDTISLSELLRAIQFYSLGGYGCDSMGEDGYGFQSQDRHCLPHSSDYNPQDWKLSLSEVLRLIQLFTIGGYHACPDTGSEDGFCVGVGGSLNSEF